MKWQESAQMKLPSQMLGLMQLNLKYHNMD